jgi:5-methylcytosine-specific restriction endonuclease McrA
MKNYLTFHIQSNGELVVKNYQSQVTKSILPEKIKHSISVVEFAIFLTQNINEQSFFNNIDYLKSHENFELLFKKNKGSSNGRENLFESHRLQAIKALERMLSIEKNYFNNNKITKIRDEYSINYEDTSILKLESNNQDDKDRQYRNRYFLSILKFFENCCARCKVADKGIHLDHFMVPRIKGGTFGLETHSGFKIHNAIPLCESCNSRKGDRNYRLFFTDEELEIIFSKIAKLDNMNSH